MKLTNFLTLVLLLFTITTLSSCIKSPSKSSKPNSVQQDVKEGKIIKVDATSFKTDIETKKVQLVDVRTPGEYTQGHLENAVNVNVFDPAFIKKISKYKKDEPVYVYCRSGGRSLKAAYLLKDQGFNVINLNGGINGWMRNGFKIIK